jgi:uncharacterized protein YndB with AHSA1/START domain
MNDALPMNDTAPVVRTIDVDAPVDKAFRVFTEGMGNWWPFEEHSVYLEHAETAVFEPRVGGRVIERSVSGDEASWGDVLEFEPPVRFVLAWRPNTRRPPTRLEVTFAPTASGTRVELIHTGWELLGDDAGDVRSSYSEGWISTLERYAGAAKAS